MKKEKVNRRRYLAALTAVGSLGLAGCGGGSGDGSSADGTGDDNENLGERVPAQPVHVYSGISAATVFEEASAHVADVLRELGVETDVSVVDPTTLRDNIFNDARENYYELDYTRATPERLDPAPVFSNRTIDKAGANGQPNPNNYASCEFSRLFLEQRNASSEEERDELIHEALATASHDIEQINITSQTTNGAYRTDLVNVQSLGEMGVSELNHKMLRDSVPRGENDTKSINVTDVHMGEMYPAVLPDLWSHTVFSSLLNFNHNRELVNSLATDYEIENEFAKITFTLREGATFHNGNSVTAEDVKYTYEFINNNIDAVTTAQGQNYDSINVIDDYTVEINFDSPNPTYLSTHAARWGIVPREHYIEQGAEENPGNPDIDPVIGSGPYQVVNLNLNQILQLEPYEDHWDTAEGNLDAVLYSDQSAAYRAFQQGDLTFFATAPGSMINQIEEGMDNAEVTRTPSFIPTSIYPQHSAGTAKFKSFRHALSQGIDRQLLNEIITSGYGEILEHSGMVAPNHPYYPENHEGLMRITDSPQGNIERAREILSQNGWGWDDDGNLHYPEGAELMLWPEDSEPAERPDDFPCVDELDLPGFSS